MTFFFGGVVACRGRPGGVKTRLGFLCFSGGFSGPKNRFTFSICQWLWRRSTSQQDLSPQDPQSGVRLRAICFFGGEDVESGRSIENTRWWKAKLWETANDWYQQSKMVMKISWGTICQITHPSIIYNSFLSMCIYIYIYVYAYLNRHMSVFFWYLNIYRITGI